MKTLEVFAKFGKHNRNGIKKIVTNNVVVYTRVSSKEQADKNLSLETQRNAIDEFTKRNHLNVIGYFGGTYESAKTDGRKEFMRMLDFIRKNKGKVSQLLVYSIDRFSRTGGAAIKIATDLREKYGVPVFAVTQPADTGNPSGVLHQNIQLLFSEYDNQLRRQKVIAGMREKFLKGIWVVNPPQGYDIIKINGDRRIAVNEDGKKIRKAFEWKASGTKNDEIVTRMKTMGVKMYKQQLCKILHNPFYCGIISHALLDGQVVEGTHEKLIGKDLFLRVHQINATCPQYGVSHQKENDNLPLKVFIRCSDCGTPLSGYIVKKKKLYYYKCRTTGCKFNKSAKLMHELFLETIAPLSIKEEYHYSIRISPIVYSKTSYDRTIYWTKI